MFKKSLKTTLVTMLALALIFTSISTAFAGDYQEPTKPVIKSFTTSKSNITMGDTIVLKWDVEGAKEIEILGIGKMQDDDKLPLKGELEMWPLESTSYILNAYGANGTMTTETVDVNVDVKGPVKILSFTASKTQVKPGETVLLKWKVQNAKAVEVMGFEKFPEGKELPALEGELEVWATATTTFVLQAVGYKGEIVSSNVTVSVLDPVSIKSVKIDKKEIKVGDSAKISWEAENATKVNISGISGDLPAKGSVKVSPNKAGNYTYKVTAIGVNGDKASDSVDLVVKPKKDPVKITSFTASKYKVYRGERVTIKWTTENAEKCMLVTSDGISIKNRPANGKITITPNKTRSFTLIAYDTEGNTTEETIKIELR